ncbi:MAG: T9SS type A sorting domain-containing protein [Chitinophagales bacterium]|nr:T9SS type A sorting domain-containing protein [Chitinophagales bacterium]
MCSVMRKGIYCLFSLLIICALELEAQTNILWPGDANRDGKVNSKDLLYVGLGYDQNGPPRLNMTTEFVPIPLQNPWGDQFPVSPIDLAFADFNGDGLINEIDIAVIDSNFAKCHPDIVPPVKDTLNLFGQLAQLCLLLPDTVLSGDSVMIPIIFESPGFPFLPDTVYGISFTFNYDINLTQDAKTSVVIPPLSWMGDPGNSINFAIIRDTSMIYKTKSVPEEIGKIEVAISGKDLRARSGTGPIGFVCIVMDENISKSGQTICRSMKFSFEDVCVISKEEKIIDVISCEDSMVVCGPPQPCDSIQNLQVELISAKKAYIGWDQIDAANEYQIRGGVVGSSNVVNLSAPAGTVFQQVTGLSAVNSYWWQVRPICPFDTTSWSHKDTFNTACPPPDSMMVFGDFNFDNAILAWSEVENAVSYQISGRQLGANTVTKVKTPDNVYIAFPLQAGTQYEWAVQSICNSFNSYFSLLSDIDTFMTLGGSSKNRHIIFPNPVRDMLSVELLYNSETPIDIHITDISGRTYFQAKYDASLTNKFNIPLQQVADGYYLLKITSDHGTSIDRLLVR